MVGTMGTATGRGIMSGGRMGGGGTDGAATRSDWDVPVPGGGPGGFGGGGLVPPVAEAPPGAWRIVLTSCSSLSAPPSCTIMPYTSSLPIPRDAFSQIRTRGFQLRHVDAEAASDGAGARAENETSGGANAADVPSGGILGFFAFFYSPYRFLSLPPLPQISSVRIS